jgi:hypothetical protein
MANPVLLPLALAAIFGAFFVGNEWSHGGFAEAMGLGHRHLFDHGGHHCASHDDAAVGAKHMEHMHDGNRTVTHGLCPGGARMHERNGTHMGGMT